MSRTAIPLAISVKYHRLEVVNQFTYLRFHNHKQPFSWGGAGTTYREYSHCPLKTRCGKTGSLQQIPRMLFTKLASSTHFCMVASPGHHMQHKGASWMSSNSALSSGSTLASQRHQYWCHWQCRYPICVHRTSPTLLTMAWTRTSDGGWPHSEKKVVPNFVTKTSASGMNALKWTTPTGNPWQTTEGLWNKNCHPASKMGNSPSKKPLITS